jgi:hypothetical protein
MNKALTERLKKIDVIRKELATAEKSAAKDIVSLLKELMKSNPLLLGMRWQQYTQNFNDGEPCTFNIYGPNFLFDESVLTKDQSDEQEGWLDEYTVDDEFFDDKADVLNFKQISALKKTVKEVQTVFSKLSNMENELNAMFGDGFQITVTPEGLESEDYDHD